MKWYENRSLDSDPKYHYMIGLKAEQEELIKKAIKHFSLAAEKDYTLAQIKLSSYLEKSNEEKDNKKARIIYKRLSDKKYPNAALRLGWMFENNFGGEKDYSSALKFYKIAASRDENEAYLYLSNLSLTSFDENEQSPLAHSLLNLSSISKSYPFIKPSLSILLIIISPAPNS